MELGTAPPSWEKRKCENKTGKKPRVKLFGHVCARFYSKICSWFFKSNLILLWELLRKTSTNKLWIVWLLGIWEGGGVSCPKVFKLKFNKGGDGASKVQTSKKRGGPTKTSFKHQNTEGKQITYLNFIMHPIPLFFFFYTHNYKL